MWSNTHIVRVGSSGVSAQLFDVNISKQRGGLCAKEEPGGVRPTGRLRIVLLQV